MGNDFYHCENCGECVTDHTRCAVCDNVICEYCMRRVHVAVDRGRNNHYICDDCYDNNTTSEIEREMLNFLIDKYGLDRDSLRGEVMGKESKYELWKKKNDIREEYSNEESDDEPDKESDGKATCVEKIESNCGFA